MRRLAFGVMLGCGTKDPVATDAGVDAAPLPSRGGAVTVVVGSYTVQEKTFGETTVAAAFAEAPSVPCVDTRSIDGTCTLTKCSGAPPAGLGAGMIHVSGLSAGDVTLSPSGTTYAPQTTPSPLFAGGETIGASAAGADLPAFTRSVVAPTFATLTAPAWPPSGPLAITRGKDFVVAWQGASSGTAFVALSSPGVGVRCEVPAKGGTLTVPAAFVDALATDATVSIGLVARDRRAAGDARAELEVTAIAARAGGSATGAAILQ